MSVLSADEASTRGVPTRARTVGTMVAYGVLALVFGIAHLLRRAPFSGYDEAAHLDYAWKLAHWRLPYPGSLIDPEMLDLWACVGQDNVSLPGCGSSAAAAVFPAGGENYLMHPPTYYVVPAITGRLAEALGFGFFEGARLGSVIWMFAGMVLLYAALRTWGVRWEFAAPVAGFVPAVHLFTVAATTVNNDATTIAAGSAALLLAGRVLVRGKVGWVLPLVVTGFFASTKVLNAVPFLAVGAAVLLAALLWEKRPPALSRARGLVILGAVVAATAIVHISWTLFRTARKVPGWTSPVAGVNTDDIQGLPLEEWLLTLFSGVRSIAYGPEWISTANGLDLALAALVSPLLLAAPVVGLLLWRRSDARWYVAVSAGLAMLALPMIVQLQTFIGSGGTQYFRLISIRYSLATLPLLIACAAFIVEQRSWVRSTWAFVIIALSISLGTVLLG